MKTYTTDEVILLLTLYDRLWNSRQRLNKTETKRWLKLIGNTYIEKINK